MSRIFRLRSLRKRWASRLSSLFSWIRLSFEINFLNWNLIRLLHRTYKLDKLSRSSSKSFGKKSKLFFDKSRTLRCVRPRKESLCNVDNWFDERSLESRFSKPNFPVKASKVLYQNSHVTDVIWNTLRCGNAFQVQPKAANLLQNGGTSEAIIWLSHQKHFN